VLQSFASHAFNERLRCKRVMNPKAKKKVRTGSFNAAVRIPGELVQVDMKCVPAQAVVQTHLSDEVRKERLIYAARRHMKSMMSKLTEQEGLFPSLPVIEYLKGECRHEYLKNVDDIRNSTLEPEKDLKLYQYTAVDVRSRWAFRWMFSEHSELASLRFAIELVKAAPFDIQCIQTDNGSEFVSDYMSGHETHDTHFQTFLLGHGILHKRITKGKPWENAHVESQHRIDQERLYDTMCVGSLDEAMTILTEYQSVSNNYPKPCLGMKSPMDIIREVV
jgi:transposase InsO family protein